MELFKNKVSLLVKKKLPYFFFVEGEKGQKERKGFLYTTETKEKNEKKFIFFFVDAFFCLF